MIGLKYYTIKRNIYIHGKTYTAVCPIYHKTNVVDMCKIHSLYIFVKRFNISQNKQDKRIYSMVKNYSFHSVIVAANHVVTTECFFQ